MRDQRTPPRAAPRCPSLPLRGAVHLRLVVDQNRLLHAEEGRGSALGDAPSVGSSAGGGGARAGGADMLLDVERDGVERE